MPNHKQVIQTSPDKVNELFAKLLETSNTAGKIRERLFVELKDELELLAKLQEEHLYPVLRKHKETQELVQQATEDNRETAALVAKIEELPKNNNEFVSNITALRKMFQRHIRDDKNELLPAVLKVLSDEEVEAVVEKVEDEIATVEETKRVGASQSRDAEKRAREQVETVQQVAADMAASVRAGSEGIQRVALTTQEAVQGSLDAAAELAQRSTERAMQVFTPSSQDTNGGPQSLQGIPQSGAVLARGMQDFSREWLSLTRNGWQQNLDGLTALTRCRSMGDMVAVQNSLVRQNIERMLGDSLRIAELSVRISNELVRTIAVHEQRTFDGSKRAA